MFFLKMKHLEEFKPFWRKTGCMRYPRTLPLLFCWDGPAEVVMGSWIIKALVKIMNLPSGKVHTTLQPISRGSDTAPKIYPWSPGLRILLSENNACHMLLFLPDPLTTHGAQN